MANIRIPTPLRPYTGGNEQVSVAGATVGEVLGNLVTQYPELKPHLFNDGHLRSFVNVFLGEEDTRFLQGDATPVTPDSKLLIIPSIAGGSQEAGETVRRVDHSALRANQAFIIGLLLAAFIGQWWTLVAFVGLVMLVGTVFPQAGLFKLIYARVLKPLGLIKPDVIPDNPEPHLFAQGLGGAFLAVSTVSLLAGVALVGWVLAWVVIILAALNLFVGFCAGCFVYYQLNRLKVPGFSHHPVSRNPGS